MRDYRAMIESIKDTLLDQYVLSKDAVFELLEERKDLLQFAPKHANLKLCSETGEMVAA